MIVNTRRLQARLAAVNKSQLHRKVPACADLLQVVVNTALLYVKNDATGDKRLMRNKFSLYRANKARPDATQDRASSARSPPQNTVQSEGKDGGEQTGRQSMENIGKQWWLGNQDESAFTDLEHKREHARRENRVDGLYRQAWHSELEPGPSQQSPSFLDSLPWESASLTLFGDEERVLSEESDNTVHGTPPVIDTSTSGGSNEGLLELFGGTMSDLAGRGLFSAVFA